MPVWLKKWKGDGIIARLQNRRIADAVVATGIPVVDVLGVCRHPEVPLVHVDNAAIAQLAAEHLLDRGFQHFGYCGINGVNWSDERRDAFVAAVARAKSVCSVYSLSEGASRGSWEDEQNALAAWLRKLPKPCGVMACNDPRGQKVLEAAHRVGIAVPEDVAVVGVDNDEPLCEISNPPLSSVNAEHSRVGYEAAAQLDRLMRGAKVAGQGKSFLQPIEVVTRQSTDVLAIEDRDVAAALRFIREHACSGISVRDVVDRLAISRSNLQKRFALVVGRSIHEEIVNVRIKRAKVLLAQTDVPLALVAERAGFKHQEYLGVVFKTHLGVTPAVFRKQNRG